MLSGLTGLNVGKIPPVRARNDTNEASCLECPRYGCGDGGGQLKVAIVGAGMPGAYLYMTDFEKDGRISARTVFQPLLFSESSCMLCTPHIPEGE